MATVGNPQRTVLLCGSKERKGGLAVRPVFVDSYERPRRRHWLSFGSAHVGNGEKLSLLGLPSVLVRLEEGTQATGSPGKASVP